jgi:hypothetical protein
VTSDRLLAQHMERGGAEVIGSAEFAERLRAALSQWEREGTSDCPEAHSPASRPQ